ncbi:hypothetical protein L2729_05355 [Shewanella gelidimarina]|uniref:hypothetical protein n=1 Tax=Shewanella gelidimarina TaxID=56813 RepID=UPI00200FE058|nr:hypothetical protein [Shewanella gelidimarina]MCL1057421.1 hypothetical protein [Shewanella gelidimarina]
MRALLSLTISFRTCLLLLWLSPSCSWASDITEVNVHNTSSIESQSFLNVSGRLGLNQSAGDYNLQTNSHAFGSHVVIVSDQKNPYLNSTSNKAAYNVTAIEELAFEGAQGLISINQVSGQGNIQANLGAIALQSISGLGIEDSALDSVASPTNVIPVFGSNGNNVSSIANDSFVNAQGIIQINQISGDGNSAINQFSLQLPSGN